MDRKFNKTLADLPGQTKKPYAGKVSNMYYFGSVIIKEFSDRLTAYNHEILDIMPYKGQVLNQTSAIMMQMTEDIIPNSHIKTIGPNLSLVRTADPIKVEWVVRHRNAPKGSFFRNYTSQGKPDYWGEDPDCKIGANEIFPGLAITTTHKNENDDPITLKEVWRNGILSKSQVRYIVSVIKKLFERGQQFAKSRGLELVDTKYEFGFVDDEIILIDETHTFDSSRYYYLEGLDALIKKGRNPVQLSKQFARDWLSDEGFEGEEGQEVPKISSQRTTAWSKKYQDLFAVLTGQTFLKQDSLEENELISMCVQEVRKHRPQFEQPQIAVLIGSTTDLPLMQDGLDILDRSGVVYEVRVLSAHRTPKDLQKFGEYAKRRGIKQIIAGAGKAAHLPGMEGSFAFPIPVIGVPTIVKNSLLGGLDALASIAQMPSSTPIATVGLNASANAALLALMQLSLYDRRIYKFLLRFKKSMVEKVAGQNKELKKSYYSGFKSK